MAFRKKKTVKEEKIEEPKPPIPEEKPKETAPVETARFEEVDVPTNHERAIRDSETGEVYTLTGALVALMNEINDISKILNE